MRSGCLIRSRSVVLLWLFAYFSVTNCPLFELRWDTCVGTFFLLLMVFTSSLSMEA